MIVLNQIWSNIDQPHSSIFSTIFLDMKKSYRKIISYSIILYSKVDSLRLILDQYEKINQEHKFDDKMKFIRLWGLKMWKDFVRMSLMSMNHFEKSLDHDLNDLYH